MAMFSGLWAGNSRSPSPTMIKEANDHMHQMFVRMQELEQRVREQTELLERREREHEAFYAQQKRAHADEVAQLRAELKKAEQRNASLENMLKDREHHIAYLLHKCSFLDEAASFVPLLENLTGCLKTSFTFQQQNGVANAGQVASNTRMTTQQPQQHRSKMHQQQPQQHFQPIPTNDAAAQNNSIDQQAKRRQSSDITMAAKHDASLTHGTAKSVAEAFAISQANR